MEYPTGMSSILRRRWPTAWCMSGRWLLRVYALNASTGALLWKYTTGVCVASSPAVADGVVYVGSRDHNLYAFHLPNQ